MIRFIAAVDSKLGIAGEHGIPWQGKVPTDVAYFREKTSHSDILMGYGVYIELKRPLSKRRNFVATSKVESLREGFEKVTDARTFLQSVTEDMWNIGGALLFASTVDLADELYITQLDADFHCTKFFPEFHDQFILHSESPPHFENGITFRFQVWRRA